MVFSSIPAYLDPANWQQQPAPNHQHNGGISNAAASTQLLPPPLPPPPPPPQPHGSGGAGSIRPGSMADRARMANIPMPETALKCPRCDSTNTKFCYFNNYSLSQPRHFCKTCRRYWTRGGALRSVPVGGGCRRNKRTKAGGGGGGSSSKSPAASGGDRQTCSSGSITSSGTADHIFGGPLRFMAPLHNFSDLGAAGDHNIGLNNYSGLNILGNSSSDLNFQSLSVSTGPTATSLYTMEQQWRFQQQAQSQFPFFGGGLDPSPAAVAAAGLLSYPFDQGGHVETSSTFLGQHLLRPKAPPSSGASVVKMEDSHQNQHHHHHQHINQDHQLSLSRQLLGNIVGNDQFWSGAGAGGGATATAWSDLSGFSSSSTSHP